MYVYNIQRPKPDSEIWDPGRQGHHNHTGNFLGQQIVGDGKNGTLDRQAACQCSGQVGNIHAWLGLGLA